MALPSVPARVRVVNTFIEVDSDEEDAANVSPIKTEPVKSFAGSSAGQPAAENAKDAPIRPVTPKMDAREVPCLLRQSLCSDYGVKVTVKNTFIDVASDEEGEDGDEKITFAKIKTVAKATALRRTAARPSRRSTRCDARKRKKSTTSSAREKSPTTVWRPRSVWPGCRGGAPGDLSGESIHDMKLLVVLVLGRLQ
ncbi:unnamed protein product [Durusdinium trenchii]|uniref:Uncharacterized protein n=1 Tax=Durusdinium trenchii TaxID=1381693 RepID=A0ABP0PFE1_9DINO